MDFDPISIRPRFPALSRVVAGSPAAYLDGPGGTQAPHNVIEAMGDALRGGTSNIGGPFAASRAAAVIAASARRAVADLFGASDGSEIAFGQNMTSITLAVSRALGATWAPGDNIVVTRLDHDANVWPWVLAARGSGAEVRWVDFDPIDGCVLVPERFAEAVDARTRLVAVTHASNALGTIVDVAAVVAIGRQAGAVTYVDAVHFTPHGLVDVAGIGCDFLVASAYKFFGPHTGCLFGRREILEELDAFKVRPAPDAPPEKWETGTQSFESLAGVTAAVDYIASLGEGSTRRERIEDAMRLITAYESMLSARFLDGIAASSAVRLFGVDRPEGRTPTFAVEVAGRSPAAVATELGDAGIFVWHGDYYAVEVMARLGRTQEGLIRVGFVHYNTIDEVDRVLGALEGP